MEHERTTSVILGNAERSSKRLFYSSLTIAWILLAIDVIDRFHYSNLFIFWLQLYTAWWGFVGALARATPLNYLIIRCWFFTILASVPVAIFWDSPRSINELVPGLIMSIIVFGIWALLVAGVNIVWRFRYKLINLKNQEQKVVPNSPVQFSLWSLFYFTTAIAVVTGIGIALARAQILTSRSGVLLLLVGVLFALWNELLQPRMRIFLLFVSVVYLGLLIHFRLEFTSSSRFAPQETITQYLGMILLTLLPPFAYRWVGWRIVQREAAVPDPIERPDERPR